jgi:ABC-2 type transport system ATP-binding protein
MINIKNLTKYYGEKKVLNNININISKGEIVGFLGPNGAGKTTTMRAMTGYLIPEEGEVWVSGFNIRKNSIQARRKIGYLPEVIPLYTDMTTRTVQGFPAESRDSPGDYS